MGTVATCSLEIEFTLKPGKRREFSRSAEELICLAGEGHVKTTVFEDRDEPGHMVWVAAWASREALESYIRSDRFSVLIGGLKVLSTGTNCRVVDEVQQAVLEPFPASRVRAERRLKVIDLIEFEGPEQ